MVVVYVNSNVTDSRAVRVFSKAVHIAEKLGKPVALLAVAGRDRRRVLEEVEGELNSARVVLPDKTPTGIRNAG